MDRKGPIVYLCAEYALDDTMPTYAGGLGILTGDLFLEAADQGLNFHLVSLHYNQETDGLTLLPDQIICPVADQKVTLRIWTKKINNAKIFLLDGGDITKTLYGPDDLTMLKQQILLGFGTIELLRLLNIKPAIYHLNEGHAALLALALACEAARANPSLDLKAAIDKIKPQVVATKHTILPSAGLHIPWELVRLYLVPILDLFHLNFADLVPLSTHKKRPELFSTTQLLLNCASRINAVSLSHAAAEKEAHPDSPLFPITNGVNQKRWQTTKTKKEAKSDLANQLTSFGVKLDPSALLIIWARRLAAYKRPHLLFSNLTRLEQIVNLPGKPVQIIIAGRAANPDPETELMAKQLSLHCREPNITGKVIFLPEYNLSLAQKLTAAADVWLNTPLPGKEASGTSGMKAALNGALQFSTADGWIAETNWSGLGWILFEDNVVDNLYNTIEKEIVPLYFDQPETWAARVAATKKLVEDRYTTTRVLNDYLTKLYFP